MILKDNKTTLFSVLVYTLKSNYLLFTYLFVPILMQEYKNTSYLAPIGCFIIVFLLIFLLPKKYGEINYNQIINKSFFAKFSYYLSQALAVILNVVIVSYTVGRMFFSEYDLIIFMLMTVGVTVFIATSSIEVIFNSSTFLLIISVLLIIFPLFLTNDVKDYSLLKPFVMGKSFTFLLLLYFGLDAISIVLSGVNTKKKISKWTLLIPVGIIFFFMSLELLNIILVTGSLFLLDNEFLGFFSLFIQDTINYVGNLGLFFLFVIPIVGCYRAAYSLRKIKDVFHIKKKVLPNIILIILLFSLTYFIINFIDILLFSYYAVLISVFLLMVVYIFIVINRSPTYEIRF